jgi:hypothetical protein
MNNSNSKNPVNSSISAVKKYAEAIQSLEKDLVAAQQGIQAA